MGQERRRLHQQAIDAALQGREPLELERILDALPFLNADERQQVRQALDELDHQSNGEGKGT